MGKHPTRQWLIFDLGATYDLETISIWNLPLLTLILTDPPTLLTFTLVITTLWVLHRCLKYLMVYTIITDYVVSNNVGVDTATQPNARLNVHDIMWVMLWRNTLLRFKDPSNLNIITLSHWVNFSTVVPEPSSYALIAGLLALGSIMMRRRRS